MKILEMTHLSLGGAIAASSLCSVVGRAMGYAPSQSAELLCGLLGMMISFALLVMTRERKPSEKAVFYKLDDGSGS